MGLYKRKSGFYYYEISDGKSNRIQKSTGTKNKKLAQRIYDKIVADIVEGRYFERLEARQHSFEELKERYMREHSKVNKMESSHIRDRASFVHLSGFFSGLSLAEVKPARISEYKALRTSEGAKTATLARELEVLRHALNLAIREWEWLDKSPFEKVRIEKPNNAIETWLTDDQERDLLNESPQWLGELITFALHTGMRQGEILCLKWSQVDLNRKSVTLLVTKNKDKRTIPLNLTVLKLLKDKSRVVNISGYVFVSKAGTRIDASNLRRAFNSAEERAGIENFRFHDLRHTFATRLVQAGVDLYVVKQLLGHKSIAMTMRYAHHYPESLRFGVEILDKCVDFTTLDKTKDLRQAVSP
jgi:integrase